jgi:hypothetical protein
MAFVFSTLKKAQYFQAYTKRERELMKSYVPIPQSNCYQFMTNLVSSTHHLLFPPHISSLQNIPCLDVLKQIPDITLLHPQILQYVSFKDKKSS